MLSLFAPRLAILDLETTGVTARRDRISEIGLLLVDPDQSVREWSTLVNPGVPIPPEIRALTGITDAMVAGAPSFEAIAPALAELLADRILVAHNARFDYAFLKAEFARRAVAFSEPTLCTVRLSRTLYPDRGPHSLDAIAARHRLPAENRHRALGDARLVWHFLQALYREVPAAAVDAAAKALLRRPSHPSHLPADAITALPEAPGVYIFRAADGAPLYVGKARNLRERVSAHFSGDHQCATDLRLSLEAHALEVRETAGELAALILEIELIHTLSPALNVALRRKGSAVGLLLDAASGKPRYLPLNALTPRQLAESFGVYGSRASARSALGHVAREARLCFRTLGLERGRGSCFNLQLQRCQGACVGHEPLAEHTRRAAAGLARLALPPWPGGTVVVAESFAERHAWHVFRDWFYVGSTASEADLPRLRQATGQPLNMDLLRLIIRVLRHRPAGVGVERWTGEELATQ